MVIFRESQHHDVCLHTRLVLFDVNPDPDDSKCAVVEFKEELVE